MEAEGVQKFFEDLGVDPMDPVTLMVSMHMKAKHMGVYEKSEFEEGFSSLGVDSISGLKSKITQLRSDYRNPSTFKEVYKFTFDFSKDPGFKSVNTETALALWDLMIGDRCKFL